MRPPNSYNFPVSLPNSPLPPKFNLERTAERFSTIFSQIDDASAGHLLHPHAVWRDTFALTGTLRTFYSADGISQAWRGGTRLGNRPDLGSFRPIPNAANIVTLPSGSSWVEVAYTFDLELANGLKGKCVAMLSLVPRSNEAAILGKPGIFRVWVMRTILDQIESLPDIDMLDIVNLPTANSKLLSNSSLTESPVQVDVVVVGGGQAGLSVAGRLQALNVSYILLDKQKNIGDSWKTRYASTRLHTPREYAHLPFDRTFPATYQEWLTKDDLAKGYQEWTRKYGVERQIWQDAELMNGKWHDRDLGWTLQVRKSGKDVVINCGFVIMATGAGGQIPKTPHFANRNAFKGLTLHSVEYKSADDWVNTRGVVVGTANTAHDIADDMLEAGLSSVTMVQRSRTYVMPREYWKVISDRTFNEKMPTALADQLLNTAPFAVTRLIAMSSLHAMAAQEKERFDALERVGFKVDPYGDIMWQLIERFGGHYMDVGTSAKIAEGRIKMKSDAAITHFTQQGLGFSDGSELEADVIVFATGFQSNMKDEAQHLFGDEVAKKIDNFLGTDDEGEIRGAWRLQHPGLILHGMSCGQARYYSRFIAFQIRAALDGKSFKVYNETPVPLQTIDPN